MKKEIFIFYWEDKDPDIRKPYSSKMWEKKIHSGSRKEIAELIVQKGTPDWKKRENSRATVNISYKILLMKVW